MTLVTCPKCNTAVARGGFAMWQLIVAVLFFPLGLLALRAGRKPATCPGCGNIFRG